MVRGELVACCPTLEAAHAAGLAEYRRRNDSRAPNCLIARFQIGEALNIPGGEVCIQQLHATLFRVFVDGGLLPDGEDERQFSNARLAFGYAAEVVAEIAAEYVFHTEG